MSIFRRRDKGADPSVEDVADPLTDDVEESPSQPAAPAWVRAQGPWDVSEVDGVDGRLDLGAVWVAPVEGMELRLEVDQSSDSITGIQFVLGDSAAQVQAFAAPRTSGLWAEIRAEVSTAITGGGGTVEEADGTLGLELRARMPQRAADGRTVLSPARFLGVDGPRWFVRAVLSGRAAVDDAAAEPLIQAVQNIVVLRGDHPMAPRELLALRLPEAALAPEPQEQADARPDLNPFERGPEITEVR